MKPSILESFSLSSVLQCSIRIDVVQCRQGQACARTFLLPDTEYMGRHMLCTSSCWPRGIDTKYLSAGAFKCLPIIPSASPPPNRISCEGPKLVCLWEGIGRGCEGYTGDSKWRLQERTREITESGQVPTSFLTQNMRLRHLSLQDTKCFVVKDDLDCQPRST